MCVSARQHSLQAVSFGWLRRVAARLHLGHVSRVSRCWQKTTEPGSLIEQILSSIDA